LPASVFDCSFPYNQKQLLSFIAKQLGEVTAYFFKSQVLETGLGNHT